MYKGAIWGKQIGNPGQDAVVPGQIAAYLLEPMPDCVGRVQILDQAGTHLNFLPYPKVLSLRVVGDRVYMGEFSGKNVVVLDAATHEKIGVIAGASAPHGHQIAVDPQTGDVYVASVYPEHGGGVRGPEGPSLQRWTPGG